MNVLRLRTLTMKSTFGFGLEDDKHLPMHFFVENHRYYKIINAYYRLSRITFTEDILIACGITEDLRISKPSKVSHEEADVYLKKCLDNIYSRVDNVVKDEKGLTALDKVRIKSSNNKKRRNDIINIKSTSYAENVQSRKVRLQSKNHGR